MRTIDFYHWGVQCPIISEMLELLDAWKFVYYVRSHDVSQEPALAKEQRMFFPFLTVVDERDRYFSPLRGELLKELLTVERVKEEPFCPKSSQERMDGIITALSEDTMKLTAKGCTMTNCKEACKKKSDFLEQLTKIEQETKIYGFLNLVKGETAGGAEFVPSTCVPYDIPKSDDTAFLTCLYHSSEQADYKSAPLNALEEYLKDNYRKLIAVTDEQGVFPNGPLSWFLANGYTDCGEISTEPGYCKLHLVEKVL